MTLATTLISGLDLSNHPIKLQVLNRVSAQIFAAEFYETAFATNPRSQQTWDRYRQLILEPGGSRDELKLMEEFLGHSPTPDALVRSLGFG